MAKSIIQDIKECYVCGTTLDLHKHHIYEGIANRKKSEKYGCWCYLCGKHHNMSKYGVHFDKALDRNLKKECQKAFERKYNEDFIKVFSKSYL